VLKEDEFVVTALVLNGVIVSSFRKESAFTQSCLFLPVLLVIWIVFLIYTCFDEMFYFGNCNKSRTLPSFLLSDYCEGGKNFSCQWRSSRVSYINVKIFFLLFLLPFCRYCLMLFQP
jgi:hypothetical protein